MKFGVHKPIRVFDYCQFNDNLDDEVFIKSHNISQKLLISLNKSTTFWI